MADGQDRVPTCVQPHREWFWGQVTLKFLTSISLISEFSLMTAGRYALKFLPVFGDFPERQRLCASSAAFLHISGVSVAAQCVHMYM
jgi:hypothetical protein